MSLSGSSAASARADASADVLSVEPASVEPALAVEPPTPPPSSKMGGAYSLAISNLEVVVARVSESIRSSTRSGRANSRSQRESGRETSWRESGVSEADDGRPPSRSPSPPTASGVRTVELGAVTLERTAPGSCRATPRGFGSPMDVLCSKFTLVQVAFNLVSSVVMSLFLFWLLFIVIGGGGPYEW